MFLKGFLMFILIESMAFNHITVSENGESMESELLLIGKHRSGRSESDLKAKAPARDLAAVWGTKTGAQAQLYGLLQLVLSLPLMQIAPVGSSRQMVCALQWHPLPPFPPLWK